MDQPHHTTPPSHLSKPLIFSKLGSTLSRVEPMAQASRICYGLEKPRVIPNFSKSQEHKSPFSVSMKTQQQLLTSSGLKKKWSMIRPVRIMASISTAEKHSKASEIVLQPIKEISGLVKLPGSKSLSNRILLLAALSEVLPIFSICLIFGKKSLQLSFELFWLCFTGNNCGG